MVKSFDKKDSETSIDIETLRSVYEQKLLERKSRKSDMEDDMTLEEFLKFKVKASDIKENPDGSLSFSIS